MSENLNHEIPPDLQDFESQLRALRPAPTSLDPHALVFEAGRAQGLRSSRRALRAWQSLATLLLGVSIGLSLLATSSRPPAPARLPLVHEVVSPETAPPQSYQAVYTQFQTSPASSDATAYLRLRLSPNVPTSPFTGGGGRAVSPLHTGDGLDALPDWQKQSVLFSGVRS